MANTKGKVFVLTGPSGVGKGTVVEQLLKKVTIYIFLFLQQPEKKGKVKGKE